MDNSSLITLCSVIILVISNSQQYISNWQALRPTEPPFEFVPGALSLRVKLWRRETDSSPPTSAADKKTWFDTSTSSTFSKRGD
jgi:hypothetical protein